MVSFPVPERLVDGAEGDGRQGWLARLPVVVRDLADRWVLEVGEPYLPGGSTAWVAPARMSNGGDVVVKVAWRHTEAEHEALGLRAWAGDGAVKLYAAATVGPDTVALLLERCVPGTSLGSRPEDEQDIVIAGLLRRLWRAPPPGHRFRPLQAMCDSWADEFEDRARGVPVRLDPGVVREGVALFRSLPATAERTVLLCTDLHAENVLAAEREPWLVIDPKPYVGDPTFDVLQHLLNCEERLHADPRGLARRTADLLDLDPERLVLWLLARCVVGCLDWPVLAEVAERIVAA